MASFSINENPVVSLFQKKHSYVILFLLRYNSHIKLEWCHVAYLYPFFEYYKFIYDATLTSVVLSVLIILRYDITGFLVIYVLYFSHLKICTNSVLITFSEKGDILLFT